MPGRDLEAVETRARIAKIEAETQLARAETARADRDRPGAAWRSPQSWILLFAAIGGLGTAVFQWNRSELASERAALERTGSERARDIAVAEKESAEREREAAKVEAVRYTEQQSKAIADISTLKDDKERLQQEVTAQNVQLSDGRAALDKLRADIESGVPQGVLIDSVEAAHQALGAFDLPRIAAPVLSTPD